VQLSSCFKEVFVSYVVICCLLFCLIFTGFDYNYLLYYRCYFYTIMLNFCGRYMRTYVLPFIAIIWIPLLVHLFFHPSFLKPTHAHLLILPLDPVLFCQLSFGFPRIIIRWRDIGMFLVTRRHCYRVLRPVLLSGRHCLYRI
jgi:hypothetical protein